MMRNRATKLFLQALAAALTFQRMSAAQYLTVYGGPSFENGAGYVEPSNPIVTNTGIAAATFNKQEPFPGAPGPRAMRWDAAQAGALELGNLGAYPVGYTGTQVNGITDSGIAVGAALKVENGVDQGTLAVRWDTSTGVVTQLDSIWSTAEGRHNASSLAVNSAGTAVGYSYQYGYAGSGYRALRWVPGGTIATELGNLGTDPFLSTYSRAYAINANGVIVGEANKYDAAGKGIGGRAVRWEGAGVTATELELPLSWDANSGALALAVNSSNTAVGYGYKKVNSMTRGDRAIRWDGSGTAAVELGNLGERFGVTATRAVDINDQGISVGIAHKYDEFGNDKGDRAVRWDTTGAVTELQVFGTDGTGRTSSDAFAINDNGFVVGFVNHPGPYEFGNVGGFGADIATCWDPDGNLIDLNSLIDPSSGWFLTSATDISDTGWITGVGLYAPDVYSPHNYRSFLLQIPEPSDLALLLPLTLFRASRKGKRAERFARE